MLLIASGMAHASTGKIGTCWGNLSTTGFSKTGKGRISAAVVIPKAKLQPYDGATIKAIRIGLVTASGVSNLTAWTRQSIEGSNQVELDVANPQAGWNEVELSTAATIDAQSDLVIGYSFDQAKSVKCLSFAGEDSDNGAWIAKDDVWQNRSDDYKGSLSVELEVEGDMVPAKNIAVESLSVDSSVIQYGNSILANIRVRNTSLSNISGDVACHYTIGTYHEITERQPVELAYGDEATISFYIPTDNLPIDQILQLNLDATTEGDGYEGDNKATLSISVYNSTVERHVLLEEFTSEHCSNCPRAIQTIEESMEAGYDKHIVQISHHVGYKYDWLTVEEDTIYEWFYGDNGTFAPAGMLDRTQRNAFSSTVPVFSIAYTDTFEPMLDIAIAEPAFVALTPNLSYDSSTRSLKAQINIEKKPQFDVLCAEPRLTVILLEDSILHHNQAGYNSKTFRHRHVYKKCLSQMWGDLIEWNGSEATLSYECTLADTIDAHYAEIVAFVSHYNPNDRNDSKVYNTCHAAVKDLTTAINTISGRDDVVSTEFFDLAGRKLLQPCPGFCIKKTTTGRTKLLRKKIFTPLH